jgi:Epoxide hydrolase N terminus
MRNEPRPFRLHIADDAVDDLRARLARTRFPEQAPGARWADGSDLGYLQALVMRDLPRSRALGVRGFCKGLSRAIRDVFLILKAPTIHMLQLVI